MSFIKKSGYLLISPLLIPVKLIKLTRSRFEFRALQAKGILDKAKDRGIKNSDPEKIRLAKTNKTYLFELWGIGYNQEDRVLRGLMFEVIIYSIFAIIPIIGLLTDIRFAMFWIASLTTSPVCLYAATGRLWRYECVKSGRFITFQEWIKQSWV